MPAPDLVVDLVKRFEENKDAYLSGRYNETELRRDFLDPFFEALGWDVRNVNNHSEKYRDVIHEQSVEVEGQAKSADYLFKIGDTPIFFVEAKKPSVDIVNNPGPAFQLKTYAWSKKLPLSLLTDFETLAFYECTSRPFFNAPPAKDRVDLFTYKDYIAKWEEISGKISRNAVTSGSYDRYVQDVKGKHGTTDVDDDFLIEMERWRNELAHNIALRNPSISQRELNFAVQATIDRIIFLRICEDRGIEPEGALKDATDGVDVYGDLLELFRKADKRYNSGLFHFSNEKGRQGYPDTLTPTLKIDDKVFKDILSNLYLPKSPYAFRYFSADILGQVYERFLGKVITLTPGHRAQVEPKPEVRKAGGVYYTPTFIVNYIVNNTVDEILKGKTPELLRSNPIRILDPACGSGSFLIGAFQYLMDWFLDWYINNDPSKWAKGKSPAIMETLGGWQLTLDKKKQILLDHIFGVDIDYQAVEVTKLSLLLKVVENPGQLSLMEERILPDLGENIKCGNSLISNDYFDNLLVIDDEERHRVNPFEWRTSFSKVFLNGGFDVVIGNPPYHSVKLMEQPDKNYFYSKYKSADKRFNLFSIFIEKSISLLRSDGLFGNILPSALLANSQFTILRRLILDNFMIRNIVDFKGGVFSGANIETLILVLTRQDLLERRIKSSFPVIYEIKDFNKQEFCSKKQTQEEFFKNKGNVFTIGNSFNIGHSEFSTLSEFVRILNGINTGNIADKIITKSKESDFCKPIIDGKDIQRYSPPNFRDQYVIYDAKYVEKLRKEWSRKKLDWTARIIKRQNYFEQEKLIVQRIRNLSLERRLVFTYDNENYYTSINISVLILKENSPYNLKYFLGILNSSFMNNFFKRNYHSIQIKNQFLSELPIYSIDFSSQPDVKRYNKMIALVEHMLALHKKYPTTPQGKEEIQQEIIVTDRQIDLLVYELYGLTNQEIEIIEQTE